MYMQSKIIEYLLKLESQIGMYRYSILGKNGQIGTLKYLKHVLLPNYNYDKLDEKNTILKVSLYLPNKVNCPNYDLYTYGGNVTLPYVSFKLWCGFPHTFGKYLHFYTHT